MQPMFGCWALFAVKRALQTLNGEYRLMKNNEMKRARKSNLNYLSCAQKVFKAKPQGVFVNLEVLPFQRGKQAFYEVSVIFMLLKRSKKRNLTS